ncbi:hypothetical protein [Lysinibacillus sp. BPa_S21]|uniref:hypothetical protein n=1 Tax=Lysinibacillus sp. BPa_S21 TaxID=2932478 RepID=UPI002010EB18|nr:hypothetical protein [Lysinibacillus sp. BPa_S21]MCL1696549.1 hypothetical protein [Lysinibacillus sp. BPa_S21]
MEEWMENLYKSAYEKSFEIRTGSEKGLILYFKKMFLDLCNPILNINPIFVSAIPNDLPSQYRIGKKAIKIETIGNELVFKNDDELENILLKVQFEDEKAYVFDIMRRQLVEEDLKLLLKNSFEDSF